MKKKLFGLFLLVLTFSFPFLVPFSANIFENRTGYIALDTVNINLPFLKHEHSENILIYFGYVGCTEICIPALNELGPKYREIKAKFPDTTFYFVNLNPSQPSQWVEPFAKHFNRDFKGTYLSKEELQKAERDFNLAITNFDNTISHSSNLYLMVKENGTYHLKRIYIVRPFPLEQIMKDLNHELL